MQSDMIKTEFAACIKAGGRLIAETGADFSFLHRQAKF